MGGASKQEIINGLQGKINVLEEELTRLRTEVQTMAMRLSGYVGRVQVIRQLLDMKIEGEE